MKKRRKKLGKWNSDDDIQHGHTGPQDETKEVADNSEMEVQESTEGCSGSESDIERKGDRCNNQCVHDEGANSCDNAIICKRCGKGLNIFEREFGLILCFNCQTKSKSKEKRSKVHWDLDLKRNEKKLESLRPKRKPIVHKGDYDEPDPMKLFSKKWEGFDRPMTRNDRDTRKVKQLIFHAGDPGYMDEEGKGYGVGESDKKKKIRRRQDS